MFAAYVPSVYRIAIAVGLSCAMAVAAHAVPITYTVNGIADGRLGATAFTGAPFTVTAVGDTASVTTPWPGIPCNDLTNVTFTISGVGSGSFISRLSIAENTGMQLLALAVERCIDAGLI